jgi:Flp pilus assembly pilin Flp
MKRRRRQSGQALIEYAFLLVLMAAIIFAVVVMAGNRVRGLYNDISYEFVHMTEPIPTAPPASTCPTGTVLEQRGHQWKCDQIGSH